MLPQSNFMVLAPIVPARRTELRERLASMNDAPGRVNPNNPLVPFAQFDTVHVARFLIVDDKTVDDIACYGVKPPAFPLYLAFLGDIDGDRTTFLRRAAEVAGPGLRSVFSCCEGFTDSTDLFAWMTSRSVSPAANYVNSRGRTVRRVREEAALADNIEAFLQHNAGALSNLSPRDTHTTIRRHVDAERSAGRLALSPEEPTPLGWQIGNFAHLVGGPLLILLASPVLLPLAAVTLLRLRSLEKTDPVLCSRCDATYSDQLSLIEDHDVSNQFTAMGSLKPGLARRWMAMSAFWIIDYAARHITPSGNLGRVRTIHFARWVFLDGRKRAVFMSNYDGSLESYMDDFINKVGFGLNFAFSSGVGYPRTRWVLLDGCSDEREFKEYLRRHQLPTEVWYKAYPGLTATDLERNHRIRQGVDTATMSDRDTREWMALI
jgi:hypothetical protein